MALIFWMFRSNPHDFIDFYRTSWYIHGFSATPGRDACAAGAGHRSNEDPSVCTGGLVGRGMVAKVWQVWGRRCANHDELSEEFGVFFQKPSWKNLLVIWLGNGKAWKSTVSIYFNTEFIYKPVIFTCMIAGGCIHWRLCYNGNIQVLKTLQRNIWKNQGFWCPFET